MALDTIIDNLRDGYKQLVPETFQHVDQLMNERRTNAELRNQCFYNADGMIYFLNGKEKTPSLAITRGTENLVLRNINDAFEQLIQNGNYRPTFKEARKAIDAENTVVIDLTKLGLLGSRSLGNNGEWDYLLISTTDYKTLNAEEQKLAQRVYGQESDFTKNMKMLADAGIGETKISVLNPLDVQKKAQKGPIGRASWLYFFNNFSGFVANGRAVDARNRLRGVRRQVSE